MKLMLAMIGVFIFIGLTQRTMTRRVYIRLLAAILAVELYFFLTWNY